jgi:hypothetical protein
VNETGVAVLLGNATKVTMTRRLPMLEGLMRLNVPEVRPPEFE